MKLRLLVATVFLCLIGGGISRLGADPSVTDTRLLAQPAVSATHIAFTYANDLWVANRDGSNVRRLTTDDGVESNPAFSPDGKLLAFSAQYEGNTDVYVVPVEGGVPVRLTWHPGPDIVQDFTRDGQAVLFTSGRNSYTTRYTQLFTVPVAGGMETQLPIPNAAQARYSPDGKFIVYNPIGQAFQQWKRYRGGQVSQLWIYNTADHGIEKIPQPATRSNDVDPMWIGNRIFFRSDRDGEFNLYAYDRQTKQVKAATSHADFPIIQANAGGGAILYEQAGWLHLFDPQANRATRLKIGVPADLRELRPRFAKGTQWIRGADISSSGARAVFEFRGDIVTVPAEKGDPRNLTETPAVHERSPAWSPDGTRIAFFSDAGGEYALHVAPQDGKGQPRVYPIAPGGGAGFYERAAWSPDSKKLAFIDNSQSIFWIDLDAGAVKKVASSYVYVPGAPLSFAWSPDSKWIAYAIHTSALQTTLFVHALDQAKSFPITNGLAAAAEPVFDRSGKYLYFFGSTDAGPVLDWFSQASADMRESNNIYVVVLSKDLPSPLVKESDEEKGPRPPAAAGAPPPPPAEGQAPPAAAPRAPAPTRIDLDGIEYRILDLPVPAGELSDLTAGEEGFVYFRRAIDGRETLQRFDLSKRRVDTLLPGVTAFQMSADGKKVLYASAGSWFIAAAGATIMPGLGKLNTDAIDVRVDPRVEWPEIFNEAWRVNRDYFYAPNMHGVDWEAMRKKYAVFLPDLSTRADLNRVIQWMASELSVGHHRMTSPGDTPFIAKTVPGGLLGADFEIANGRYRFKKVYGGLNFNPQLRSPLTEPGVNVRSGDYLLAVRGRDLRPPTNVYSLFENTSGKAIEMTVGSNPDGTGSRVVTVVPVASEAALRNRDWVEGNLKKVDAATGGRVAYVYVPDTGGSGHTYFKRYFFPQAQKDAVIVDERFNGGGSVADYYIDILRRPFVSMWAMRYGADLKTPMAGIDGPKVLIVNETAGSGGDLLPWMFRKFKVGTIVGQRTWGGLVGILGFPPFIDGGGITAPNLAIWTPEEGWVVENEGVPPDIAVEQTPADVIAGRDPQLERAIQVALDELKKNPPKPVTRPPFPIKSGRGGPPAPNAAGAAAPARQGGGGGR
jgi:tricorn protease